MHHSHWRQLVTFAVIGLINTFVDLIVFVLLRSHQVPLIVANIVSTSLALGLSFVLNRKFTFRVEQSGRRTFLLFVVVTLIGLWVLQPAIIVATSYLLKQPFVHALLSNMGLDTPHWITVFSKIAAVPFTLAWNFVLYKIVVFRPAGTPNATDSNAAPSQPHNQSTTDQPPVHHYKYRPTRPVL